MIDGSGSIEQAGRGNFNRIKSFVKDVIAGFNVGLSRAIDKILYPSVGTYTGKALNWARSQLYTQHQDRKGIPNLCILITDGKAIDDVEAPADALECVDECAIWLNCNKPDHFLHFRSSHHFIP